MSRFSMHLPRVGALVLSVAVAMAAYSVHEGQSTTSSAEPAAPAAARAMDLGGSLFSPPFEPGKGSERSAGTRRSAGGSGPDGAPDPSPGARRQAELSDGRFQFVAANQLPAPLRSLGSPPQGVGPRRGVPPPPRGRRHHGLDDRSIDRELQRLIGDEPVPRRPKRPTGDDGLDGRSIDRELRRLIGDEPVPDRPKRPTGDDEVPPSKPVPGDGAPSGSPSGDPPDAGLDETDLGAPVDETDDATTNTPSAPTDPAPVSPPPPAAPTDPAPVSPAPPPAAAPPPAQTDPAPTPVTPDDQTGNADDEDAGVDDQSGEAEDETPVAPGGSEGADAGVPGDGDGAPAPPTGTSGQDGG